MRISDWSSDVCSSDLLVIDKPGVIADVAAALRDDNISMESVIQRGRAEGEGEAVPVIIMTHDTKEAQIQRALARIAELAVVVEQPRLRSEEHTSELQSLTRISYAVFCLTTKKKQYEVYTELR